METRKERYSKYRQEIKLTPESAFSSSKKTSFGFDAEDQAVLRSVNTSSKAISYGSILEPLEPARAVQKDSVSPYEKYLARKRRAAITKVVFFVIVVAALAVWFVLIQKGR